jgi:hypothetical protein
MPGTVTPPPSPTSTPTGFGIGVRVQTLAKLNVRSTPTTKGRVLGFESRGSRGSIIGGPTSANGYIWWKVSYDNGVVGWSAQSYLSLLSALMVNNGPLPTPAVIENPTSPVTVPTTSPTNTPTPTNTNNNAALIASIQAQINQLEAQIAALQSGQ